MVKGDAGAGEGLLDGGGDAGGVSVGGNGDGTTVVDLDQGGTDVLRYGVRLAALGDLAVLYVPPHRRLRPRVLRLRLRRLSPSAPGSHVAVL